MNYRRFSAYERKQPFFFAVLLLCLTSATLADELKRRADLGAEFRRSEAGIRISEIKPKSLAARIDLARDDLLIAINGRKPRTPAEAQGALRQLHAGDKVALEMERAGRGPFRVEGILPEASREEIDDTEVFYDSVRDSRNERLRTIITKPRAAHGKLPVVFVAGWLSDDTVEAPAETKDAAGLVFRGLAALPNFVTVRMDKPGVGDSEGDCAETDFETELSGYRAAFESLGHYDFIDPNRVFVLGISNGGGFAPLIPRDAKSATAVRGYIVVGGWVKTWFEHMLEIERRRLTLSAKSPGQINEAMKQVAAFYERYLIEVRTPAEILREMPQLKNIWNDDGTHQYGRPAAFYHQLQRLNLEEAWSHVAVPTLVLHGQFDWIMSRDDHERIAALVNANRPGAARFIEVPAMGHTFQHFPSMAAAFKPGELPFDPAVLHLLTDWLSQHRDSS